MAQHLVTNRFSFTTMNKLVLVRHGESIWNKHKRWAGWKDIRLSSTGIKQARQCGAMLKAEGFVFDQAYCSLLTRSVQTLNYILDEMNLHYIPVHKNWRLNEKHYGSLTGQNKVEIAQKYGEEKVADWRRSFTVAPPPLDKYDQRNPINDNRYSDVAASQLPNSQNQRDVINRVRKLWQGQIRQKILEGKQLIISAHGSSIRALVKLISNFPDQDIRQLNIPHTTPLVYNFQITPDKKLRPHGLEYLGNLQDITIKMARIKNQAKANGV